MGEIAAPLPGDMQNCMRCGCEFDYWGSIRESFAAGVKVLEEGTYCASCMKELSGASEKESMKEKVEDMEAVLERMNDGGSHEGHEALVAKIVEALRNTDEYRQKEYTYDASVLALSLGLLAETELKRVVIKMHHHARDEDHEFAQLAGRFDSMRKQMDGWISDMNDLCSDLCVYSVSKTIVHPMDKE